MVIDRTRATLRTSADSRREFDRFTRGHRDFVSAAWAAHDPSSRAMVNVSLRAQWPFVASDRHVSDRALY